MRLQSLHLGEKSLAMLPTPSSKSQIPKALLGSIAKTSTVKIMLMHMTLKHKQLNLVNTTFNLLPTWDF